MENTMSCVLSPGRASLYTSHVAAIKPQTMILVLCNKEEHGPRVVWTRARHNSTTPQLHNSTCLWMSPVPRSLRSTYILIATMFGTRFASYGMRTLSSRLRMSPNTSIPKAVRPLTTTASLGFSLMGLFNMNSVTDVLGTSESSSILREASQAAPTKQPYTLVFVNSSEWGVSRNAWQSWIMYFREAGYDCIDMRVETASTGANDNEKTRDQLLAEQISQQVRLASLQRQPVLFLRDNAASTVPSYLGQGGLFTSTRGPMSGLVLLHPPSADVLTKGDWPSNTPIMVVPKSESDVPSFENNASSRNIKILGDKWNEKEGLIKEVENWMRYVGL